MKIKTIITGSTGMVGEGVLHECLKHPDVESVLVIKGSSNNFNILCGLCVFFAFSALNFCKR